MSAEKKYGLIGRNISYSFSKKYFTEKFRLLHLDNHSYDIYELSGISEIEELCREKGLSGFNVTIPYKREIIPYLNSLSEEAVQIGAVNTVVVCGGKTKGYNTDAAGFEKTLLKLKQENHQSALILGNGGAAKAVKYVLRSHGIPYETVYRKGNLNFDTLTAENVSKHSIIIQTTPVGTFPNVNDSVAFPFEALSPEHLVIDLIYNPPQTAFLNEAAARGSVISNGQLMLEQQAEKAWEIWSSTSDEL